MARSHRSTALETRTNRLKIPQGARELLTLGKGLALAYRRADDYQEANGADVLDVFQAQGKARDFYELATKGHVAPAKGTTVNKAAEDYLAWFREHRRAVAETE